MTLELRSTFFVDLLPADVVVCATEPHRARVLGFEEEELHIINAVDKRKNEFRAGRACAHEAMSQFSVPRTPLRVGKDREPLWPSGIVGSISHSSTYCAAAVARADDMRAIGIDLELAEPLAHELRARVCTESELRANANGDPLAHRIIFSAKETTYKCLHPIVQVFFGFHAAEITFTDAHEFEVELLKELQPFAKGERFKGQYKVERGHIVTALTLRR